MGRSACLASTHRWQMMSSFGRYLESQIFAIPISNKFLLYAPLHNLAALMDLTAARRLRDGLLHGEAVAKGRLGEIARVLSDGAEPAPLPKRGGFVPSFLGLLPTRGCNLSCRYCGFLTSEESQNVMGLELARDAVNWYMDAVERAGVRHAEVHYFGGEPFCVEEVLDFTVHLARVRAEGAGCTVRFEVAAENVAANIRRAERRIWLRRRSTAELSCNRPSSCAETHDFGHLRRSNAYFVQKSQSR